MHFFAKQKTELCSSCTFLQSKKLNFNFPEQFIAELEDNKEVCSYNSGKWDFKVDKDKITITKYDFNSFIIKIELKRTSGIMNDILNLMKNIKKNMIAIMNNNAIKYIRSYDRFSGNDKVELAIELNEFNEFKYACPEYKELYAELKQEKYGSDGESDSES